jgi:hypothetical protein
MFKYHGMPSQSKALFLITFRNMGIVEHEYYRYALKNEE